MKSSKTKNWIGSVIILLSLILGYFSVRLYALTSLPIFTDEAIYIRWSQIGSRDASWRFISLWMKQPLFTWIMMVYLKIFHDPLLPEGLSRSRQDSRRFWASCVFHIISLKQKITCITALLYLVSPFSLMC